MPLKLQSYGDGYIPPAAIPGGRKAVAKPAFPPAGFKRVSEIRPGEGFEYTSKKNARNTAKYIRIESKQHVAGLNLTTFKQVNFDGEDEIAKPIRLKIDRI